MRVLLIGANGRLGQEIQRLAASENQRDLEIIPVTRASQNFDDAARSAAVVLDVSNPKAALEYLGQIKHSLPYVVGCTGFDDQGLEQLRAYSKQACMVIAPNFSIAVNLMLDTIEKMAPALLKLGYEVSIRETHHQQKKDAPSGTAKKMIEKLRSGANPKVESVRTGSVVGTHEICFSGKEDIFSMKHEALDRKVFARGAILAARWAVKTKKPGLYSMSDVVSENRGG